MNNPVFKALGVFAAERTQLGCLAVTRGHEPPLFEKRFPVAVGHTTGTTINRRTVHIIAVQEIDDWLLEPASAMSGPLERDLTT